MKKDTNKFTVPSAGYYNVSGIVYHCTPTGKYKIVKNPNKSWWKFWEPDTITKEIMEYTTSNTGLQVVYLEKGQSIDSTFLHRL